MCSGQGNITSKGSSKVILPYDENIDERNTVISGRRWKKGKLFSIKSIPKRKKTGGFNMFLQ